MTGPKKIYPKDRSPQQVGLEDLGSGNPCFSSKDGQRDLNITDEQGTILYLLLVLVLVYKLRFKSLPIIWVVTDISLTHLDQISPLGPMHRFRLDE